MCLINHNVIKMYGKEEVWLHAFLSSALGRGEWSDSRPGRFTLGLRDAVTNWIRVWVRPRAGLDAVARKKQSLSMLEIEPRSIIL
jgi:hypothetical protein